jgi:hypothetical protein
MGIISDHTETVNQSLFVEALRGPGHPSTYLNRFPENVYNVSPDSVLYKLIYTLIGPSGVASLKRGYFEARLKFEEMGLQFNELEKFYANPMGFGRIASEVYSEDPTGLLNNDIWSRVKAQDQAYRNRVIDFLHGARLGGTPEGMRYVAKSALGVDVDIIEGYKYLFDQNSDQIIGYDSLLSPNNKGTYSTEKFAIAPKPETSATIVQTIRFEPIPDSGTFAINYGLEQTTINIVDPISGARCTAVTIQQALSQFQSIQNNVRVSGDPFTQIKIQFVGQLANQSEINIFTVDASDLQAINGYDSPSPCAAIVESNSGVISPNEEDATASPQHLHALQLAVDKVRPVTAYPVTISSRSSWHQIIFDANAVSPLASSEYTKGVRYVTGSTDVSWPPTNSIYWIQSGVEVESPSVRNDYKESYQDFHIVNKVYSYDDNALNDVDYNSTTNILSKYKSTHQGSFGPDLTNAIPALQEFDNSSYVNTIFEPSYAIANHAKPRTATSSDPYTETALIDGIYPINYFKLPNVPNPSVNNLFWASKSNVSGSEYLEIDFGETKAVNFIAFEILQFPIDLEIAYDDLDFDGYRNYVSVTPENMPGSTDPYPFDTAFFYDRSNVSPWSYTTYNFKDLNQKMIYTRFIRIKFTRRTTQSVTSVPFLIDNNGNQLSWPVCIRNFRIGRNV